MRTSLRSRSALSLFAVPAVILMLAGCMGSSPENSGPSESEGDASNNVTSDAEFNAARDAYDLKLAECMRGKGLEVADPKPGEGITESGPEFLEAASACSTEIGAPPTGGTPPSAAEMLETGQKEVKCFRKLGYEVDEPSLGQQYTLPDATDEDFETCLID